MNSLPTCPHALDWFPVSLDNRSLVAGYLRVGGRWPLGICDSAISKRLVFPLAAPIAAARRAVTSVLGFRAEATEPGLDILHSLFRAGQLAIHRDTMNARRVAKQGLLGEDLVIGVGTAL